MTALSKKKDDYIAQRNARKLEESTVEMESKGTSKKKSNSKNKHVSDEELEKMVFASENEYLDQPTQLDLIQEQMKQIEHDFPTVLLEQTQLRYLSASDWDQWRWPCPSWPFDTARRLGSSAPAAQGSSS